MLLGSSDHFHLSSISTYQGTMAQSGGVSAQSPRPQSVGYYSPPNGILLPGTVNSPGPSPLEMPSQLPPVFNRTNQLYSSTPNSCHYGRSPYGYGIFPNLNTSLPGDGLIAQPIQSMPQANPTMGFYDGHQDKTPLATDWAVPLTVATSNSSGTIHEQPSPSVPRRSTSPPACYDFVMEDPTNPHCYREKRFRSRNELDQQKEEIRHLKEYGGACLSCYRSKKKCGPSNPCPPCLTNGRECVRRNQTSLQANYFDQVSSSPSVNPHIDEFFDILQPGPWELVDSIDGACDEICFGTGFIQNPGQL